MENEYIYKTPDLCEAVHRSRWTIIKWEKQGRFTPPRSIGGHRVFTQEQIHEIARQFSPGGEYVWHFDRK